MSVELYGWKVGESDLAVCFRDEETGEETWFPLSQVESMHFHQQTRKGSIIVTDWIAKQKNLI